MKLKIIVTLILLTFFLVGCAAAPKAETAPENPETHLGAGFRYSTYGVRGEPGPEYWASVGERMAAKFPGATPEAIWIIGNIYGNGTYLNFPCETDDPNIRCGHFDMNEEALTLFDQLGFHIWLQVEAGNADMEELIDLVLDRYGHHSSVVGFGVDIEWYKSPEGPLGVPITDEEAARWVTAVRKHNPDYRIFLKHWELEWTPPNERDGILFINDHQEFDSLEAMIENFSAWGEHFEGYPVGYQFGYLSDRVWWGDFDDPAGEIGNAILEQIPNTAALFWVDFTVMDVFPPEDN